MVKKQKKVLTWIGDRAPYISLIVIMSTFVFTGVVSIQYSIYYKVAALAIVIFQLVSIIVPKFKTIVLISDLLTMFWFIALGREIYNQLYPQRATIFGVLLPIAIAIFIAFGAPLRMRVYRKKVIKSVTPHIGENLTPHFSSVKRRGAA